MSPNGYASAVVLDQSIKLNSLCTVVISIYTKWISFLAANNDSTKALKGQLST